MGKRKLCAEGCDGPWETSGDCTVLYCVCTRATIVIPTDFAAQILVNMHGRLGVSWDEKDAEGGGSSPAAGDV